MSRAGSGCEREDLRRIMVRYEFGAVTAAERSAFEKHVLECDDCFEQLERGAVPMALLRSHSSEYRQLLLEPPFGRPLRARFGSLSRGFRPRVLLPAAAVLLACLATTWWASRRSDVTRLATFPSDSMRSTATRAPSMPDAEHELLEAGASYFDLGRYDEAARRFRAALQRHPDSSTAAYALGLSLALSGDARDAIAPLESAVRLADGEMRERAQWVLGNAYLKSGQVAAARTVFERLGATSSDYSERARQLASRLGS